MPRFGDADSFQDFLFGCGDLGWEGFGGAVEGDGCRSQRSGLLNDVGDGQAGAFLDVVGYGRGGDHDGQVAFDRVADAVEYQAARRSLFDIRSERSTRHRSWYQAITSAAGMTTAGRLVT